MFHLRNRSCQMEVRQQEVATKTKTLYKAKKGTVVASKSKKMKLEASPEQLEILSVKEDNDQIKIEFRAPNTSAISIAGAYEEPHGNYTNTKIKIEDDFEFGAISITAQSIPTTGVEPTKDEVDIKIEDEMEFFTLNSTALSIPGSDDEDHINPPIQNHFAEIKIEDEIEIGEPSISVQSIPTINARKCQTIHDEYAKIEDEMEFGDEVEKDELNTLRTTFAGKPDVSEGNKPQSELICNICSKLFLSNSILQAHLLRCGKPNFHCTICDVVKFTHHEMYRHMRTHDTELDRHMRMHDTNPVEFTCELCPKKYTLKSNLTAHLETHKAKLFKCEICSMEFTTKNHLKMHRMRHGKPKLNYL